MNIVIKPYYIAPDIQYYLDGAITCGTIPLDVYIWAKLFVSNINSVVDNFSTNKLINELKSDHISGLALEGQVLEKMYLEWQENSSIQENYLCLFYAAKNFKLGELIENIAPISIEEKNRFYPIGNKKEKVYEDENFIYYDYLKEFEKRNYHILESYKRISEQWNEIKSKIDINDINIIYERDDSYANITANISSRYPRITGKKQRKAIIRSAELLDSVTGEKTTKLFLSGKKVTVEGRKYKFELTKTGSVDGSHGVCSTQVFDIKTDEYIASICVYTEGVTVLDHLASIVMHCKTGLEDLIINESNLIHVGNKDLLPHEKKLEKEAQDNMIRLITETNIENKTETKIQKMIQKANRNIIKKVVPKYNIKPMSCGVISNRQLLEFCA